MEGHYDANDRFTAGDTYDADGNTVSSGGIANTYDFENRLLQKGGGSIIYDGDGNRVSKTVAGVTTKYLVDDRNPTGYAQVVFETFSGNSSPNSELNHVYVYGLELIGQTRNRFDKASPIENFQLLIDHPRVLQNLRRRFDSAPRHFRQATISIPCLL